MNFLTSFYFSLPFPFISFRFKEKLTHVALRLCPLSDFLRSAFVMPIYSTLIMQRERQDSEFKSFTLYSSHVPFIYYWRFVLSIPGKQFPFNILMRKKIPLIHLTFIIFIFIKLYALANLINQSTRNNKIKMRHGLGLKDLATWPHCY